jgi:hypothetical protein
MIFDAIEVELRIESSDLKLTERFLCLAIDNFCRLGDGISAFNIFKDR